MEFHPPIEEVQIISQDERRQSCSVLVRDTLDQRFSLLVQTQLRFTQDVLTEPPLDANPEPVLMINQDRIDENTIHTVINGIEPHLLARFLVAQEE